MNLLTGTIFDIQRFSTANGPGIRTTAFLKGCPLGCAWCHNPESASFRSQPLYTERLCARCGMCAAACGTGARALGSESMVYDAAVCDGCGNCAEACMTGALDLAGSIYTVTELTDELARDMPFFGRSGGGITLSGGEPLAQYDFCVAVLCGMRSRGIHTVLDTSGYCDPDAFRDILPLADLLLYDVKLVDEAAHIAATGRSNKTILFNLEQAVRTEKPIRIRFPLVPEYTDSDENLEGLCRLLKGLAVTELEVSVYHEFGESKYTRLFETPPDIRPYDEAEKEDRLARLTSAGLTVRVV